MYSLDRKLCVLFRPVGDFENTVFVRWNVIYSILRLCLMIYSQTEEKEEAHLTYDNIIHKGHVLLYQRGDKIFENDCTVA